MKTAFRMKYQRSLGYEDEPLDVMRLLPAVMAQVDLIRLANKILNKDSLPMKFRIIIDLELKCFDIEIDDGKNPILIFFNKLLRGFRSHKNDALQLKGETYGKHG